MWSSQKVSLFRRGGTGLMVPRMGGIFDTTEILILGVPKSYPCSVPMGRGTNAAKNLGRTCRFLEQQNFTIIRAICKPRAQGPSYRSLWDI